MQKRAESAASLNVDDQSSGNDEGEQKKKVGSSIISMIGEYSMSELKKMHPQRNVFNFGHITISSDFDSGNLSRCEEGDEDGCVSINYFPHLFNC